MATFLLRDVFKITGLGVVAVGEVKSGVLRIGMKSGIGGKPVEIKSMEMHHSVIKQAAEGQNVGILLKNADCAQLKNLVNTEIEFSDVAVC